MGDPSGRARVTVAVAAVALGIAVGALPLIPPRAAESSDPTAFSVGRAESTIAEIATEPRPLGSAANARGREQITGTLEDLGLDAEIQSFVAPDYYGSGDDVEGVNVLSRIPGDQSTGAIVLIAHHDTVPGTPGAADDGSGVAILLEVGRVVSAGSPLRNDLILLFTDGEEPAPRYGSTRFVEEHPWSDDVALAVNLEAIGSGGPSLLTDASDVNAVVDAMSTAAPAPVVYSFLTSVTSAIGGSNTDLAPFRESGVPGVEFAFAHGSSIYHTPRDTPENLSAHSLDQHGRNTLALVRHFGDVDLAVPDEGGDPTFFTVGRHTVVRYPSALDTTVAALAFVITLLGARLHEQAGSRLRELGRLAARVAGVAAVAAALWWLIGTWRSEMGPVEAELWLTALAALTVGLVLWRRQLAASAVVVAWAGLALLVALALPGVAAVFAWPALGAALVVSIPNQLVRLAGAAVTTVLTLMLTVPFVDIMFVFAQPRPGNLDSQMLWMAALPIAVVALVALLLSATLGRTREQTSPDPG